MSDLPGILRDIEALIGRDAALDLAEAIGGSAVHVPGPSGLHPDHLLVQAIGNQARCLASAYKGEKIYVPMARHAVVARLFRAGLSRRQIARRIGVSDRTVRRLLR